VNKLHGGNEIWEKKEKKLKKEIKRPGIYNIINRRREDVGGGG